jgi:hypothetical protein
MELLGRDRAVASGPSAIADRRETGALRDVEELCRRARNLLLRARDLLRLRKRDLAGDERGASIGTPLDRRDRLQRRPRRADGGARGSCDPVASVCEAEVAVLAALPGTCGEERGRSCTGAFRGEEGVGERDAVVGFVDTGLHPGQAGAEAEQLGGERCDTGHVDLLSTHARDGARDLRRGRS